MLQFDANANAHANVDGSVNGPLVVDRYVNFVYEKVYSVLV